MFNFEENSLINIKAPYYLSSSDEEMLGLVYLPLLGVEAFSTYHLLLSLGKETSLSTLEVEDFALKLGIKTVNLTSIFTKLEALNLVSTYRKQEDDRGVYLLLVKPPLKPFDFFIRSSNESMRELVKNKVGERNFVIYKKHFKVEDKIDPSYINISAEYSDVYIDNLDTSKASYLSGEELASYLQNEETKSKKKFDREVLREKLKELNVIFIQFDENYQEIERVCSLYDIDESIASKIISEHCLTTEGFFSLDTFIKHAKNHNRYGFSRIEAKKSEEISSKDINNLVRKMETLSPSEFLADLLRSQPTPSYLSFINELSSTYKIPNPFINLVMSYTVNKCDGYINFEFARKVAISLASKEINTVLDGLSFLYNREEKVLKAKKKYSSSSKPKKEEKEEKIDIDLDSVLGEEI